MKRFYVHFTENPVKEIPALKTWRTVNAETHRDAALVALKKRLPWQGLLWAHVHGYKDPKHANGMPMVCQTLELRID